MSREILFRGKRIDNGEWVEGNLIHRTRYYGDTVDDYFIMEAGEFDNDYYDAYEVYPETVGQYTGLTDKNGTKVFEGDIVRFKHCDFGEVNGYVRYDDEMLSWQIIIPSVRWDEDDYLCNYRYGDCEVIGNKWDNADLLEGENG